ncbi:hypothetical protein [Sphingobium sp. CR28]|uniref:hypothetical protein n=1 Tax=Sphingobium sp. CR28 TaxID=3400272 RepID=UPI003FEF3A64
MGGLWTLVTVLGPVLLLAVLAYVLIRRRQPSPREEARLDQATKTLRDDLDREDKAREEKPGV